MNRCKRILCQFLAGLIVLVTCSGGLVLAQDQATEATPTISAKPTKQQLQQLVAPIALYPDSLVAQMLAASTYPAEIVEADRWLQANPDLKGDQLAQAVNQQPWDPSVKGLTETPSVLENMDKNLSWTSSLGDAYINDQKGVMDAIQQMRKDAKKTGHLESNSQEKVTDQGHDIIIEPATTNIVYVPEYDPWLVYGYPVAPWPGWYWYPGLYWTEPGIGFGVGFGVGFFSGFGWGWHRWQPDWHHNYIAFDRNRYISHSPAFVDHNYYANRARNFGGQHGGNAIHGSGLGAPHTGNTFHDQHGFAGPHAGTGGHMDAFGGFGNGGEVRGYSARGFSSMGGFHGGMGGFHGGGGGGHR